MPFDTVPIVSEYANTILFVLPWDNEVFEM